MEGPPHSHSEKTESIHSVKKTAECHSGRVQVFQKELSGSSRPPQMTNLIISGGGKSKGVSLPWGAVAMDLSGFGTSVFSTRGVSLPTVESGFRSIHLDWPDYGKPPVGKQFWMALVDDLLTLAHEEDGLHVVVYCSMGHGRTGTALAILGGLLKCIPEGVDPIDHVRSVYCKESVESEAQIGYIESILGYTSTCKPATTKTIITSSSGYEYGYTQTPKAYETPSKTLSSKTIEGTRFSTYPSSVHLSQRWISIEGKLCDVKRSLSTEEYASGEWKWDPMSLDYYRVPKKEEPSEPVKGLYL